MSERCGHATVPSNCFRLLQNCCIRPALNIAASVMSALQHLAREMPPPQQLRLLSGGLAPDSAKVYLLKNERKVLRISPPEFPNVVREMTHKAKMARDALGPQLGRPIPLPLQQWESEGVSCALFEEFVPISRNKLVRWLQVRRVAPLVLTWLRDVAEIDRGPNNAVKINLEALASCPSQSVRAAALSALSTMHSAARFRSAVMHGDLWTGNLLLPRSTDREFVIIDWGGSIVDGFPIFDLVRFGEAIRLGSSAFRKELVAHARILDCELRQTRTYLLAALGHIWRNLQQFPAERFASMAARNLRTIDAALNG